jgi:hypothetical protein
LPVGSGLNHSFNYARNSVKAVVDAYEGSVSFYVVDEDDPIVRAWRSAFPSLFRTTDELPEGMQDHFRYPEDLFRVQTTMYAKYHVTNPTDFFQGEKFWNVAQQPPSDNPEAPLVTVPAQGTGTTTVTSTDSSEGRFIPYYGLLRHADATEPEFSLVRPFVPVSRRDERRELAAFMTVSGDPESYGKLRVYQVRSDTLVDGPSLVASNITQQFAADLTLQSRAGSSVLFGDLQLLPIGDSLVYLRPWYVQAQVNPVPDLRYVLLTLGRTTARGESVEDALRQVFPNGDFDDITTRLATGGASVEPTEPSEPTEPTTPTEPTDTTVPGDLGTVEELLAEAQSLYAQAQDARAAGDVTRYIELLEEAGRLAEQAAELVLGEDVTATTTPLDTDTTVLTTVDA